MTNLNFTGRDLIMYILSNGLENEPVFKDGKLIGFMTAEEAAVKFNVGPGTIQAWVRNNYLCGIRLGDSYFIPSIAQNPIERNNNEKTIKNTNNMSTLGIDPPCRSCVDNPTPRKCVSSTNKN